MPSIYYSPRRRGGKSPGVTSTLSRGSQHTVAVENYNTGDSSYALANFDETKLAGWGEQISVAPGGSLAVHASSTIASCTYRVYRWGYYQDSKARKIKDTTAFTATNTFATATQLDTTLSIGGISGIAINNTWATYDTAFTLSIPTSWVSGLYAIRLSNGTNTSWVHFVVKDTTQKADILVVCPDTTWQAYNPWNGYSIYSTPYAPQVSYDRPFGTNNGTGSPFPYDIPIICWLEKQGYDMTYTTVSDLDIDSTLLRKYKVVVSLGHDEYWTQVIRDGYNLARDSGTSICFLGANTGYSRIRFQAGPVTGGTRRSFVCYKNGAASDPDQANLTDNFRVLSPRQSENTLLGGQYWAFGNAFPWVVSNPTHWSFTGTGVINGSSFDSITGYEYDTIDPPTDGHGPEWGTPPPGLEVLSTSPVSGSRPLFNSHSTFYRASGGGGVFSTGSMYWPPRLQLFGVPWPSYPETERVMRNIMSSLIYLGRVTA